MLNRILQVVERGYNDGNYDEWQDYLINNKIVCYQDSRFELYCYWKLLWYCAKSDCQDYSKVDFVLKDLSSFSGVAQETLVLTLRNQMDALASYRLCELFGEYAHLLVDTLPVHAILWLLEIIRNIRKKTDLKIDKCVARVIIRLEEFTDAYKCKVMSELLRIATPGHLMVLCSPIATILQLESCRSVLHWLTSEEMVKFKLGDGLGLIVVSNLPSARIFVMRLVLYLVECLIVDANCVDQFGFLTGIYIEMWTWSSALITLFNGHEGLLYKILDRILQLEVTQPVFMEQYRGGFGSIILYHDLLCRLQFSAEQMIYAILINFDRVTSYLIRIYKAGVKRNLFGIEWLGQNPKIIGFHQDLLTMLEEKIPLLVPPIRRYLHQILQNSPNPSYA